MTSIVIFDVSFIKYSGNDDSLSNPVKFPPKMQKMPKRTPTTMFRMGNSNTVCHLFLLLTFHSLIIHEMMTAGQNIIKLPPKMPKLATKTT